MLTSMMEIFDPCLSYNYFYVYSLPMILMMIFFSNNLWMENNHYTLIKDTYLKIYFSKEMSKTMTKSMFITIFLMASMFYLIVMNFFGLSPYIFTTTVLASTTFTISMLLFVAMIYNMLSYNYKNSLVHLVPKSTPLPLMAFLVMIEMISLIIRPLTLSLRLMANLMAGHLIMSLISSSMLPIMLKTLPSYLCMMFINVMETGVAMIQCMVLTLLLHLYSSDSIN